MPSDPAVATISICIPAYQRVEFLRRLLDSIAIQTFTDFEVVITDDTPGTAVYFLAQEYKQKFKILYHKNETTLGTPENWNEAIRRSSGTWIKLMHDDDWFAEPTSLQQFMDAANANPQASFLFSAYYNVTEGSGKTQIVLLNRIRKKRLLLNPVTLFSRNVIGPPSVTMYRNDRQWWYDRKVKWVVDIDFYIRYLKGRKPVYISRPLINVGINPQQVTHTAFRKPQVEIPENFYLLDKVGHHHLRDIMVYDGWWRLMRNLNIRNEQQIRNNGYAGPVPVQVRRMINIQKKIPRLLLKTGVFSKLFMFASYLLNRK
ncbi:MAG TPA: glycosyltransferase [Chitinophagaceae bacterium]|nr:glycosyltransferase [Chitinophagaceae bacterium]